MRYVIRLGLSFSQGRLADGRGCARAVQQQPALSTARCAEMQGTSTPLPEPTRREIQSGTSHKKLFLAFSSTDLQRFEPIFNRNSKLHCKLTSRVEQGSCRRPAHSEARQMLGLVEYSDSEGEEEPQRAGGQATAAAQGSGGGGAAPGRQEQATAPPAMPAWGLPSAEALLGGTDPSRLPPPIFGQSAMGQAARRDVGMPAAGGSGKRAHPDTRGPLPNPMSLDTKLQRTCVPGCGSASVYSTCRCAQCAGRHA